jgi:hypothetical protein
LDSQFHCSDLESRGVPGKTREIRVNAGNYLSFISGSRLPVRSFPVTSYPVMQFPVAHAHAITSDDVISGDDPPRRSPSNDKWMVPLYYSAHTDTQQVFKVKYMIKCILHISNQLALKRSSFTLACQGMTIFYLRI